MVSAQGMVSNESGDGRTTSFTTERTGMVYRRNTPKAAGVSGLNNPTGGILGTPESGVLVFLAKGTLLMLCMPGEDDWPLIRHSGMGTTISPRRRSRSLERTASLGQRRWPSVRT
jgi:hypothetical protein